MARIRRIEKVFRENLETHACYLFKVARGKNPQHLDCNMGAVEFAFPNISVPAVILLGYWSNVATRDLDGFRKQRPATAYLAQDTQTLLL